MGVIFARLCYLLLTAAFLPRRLSFPSERYPMKIFLSLLLCLCLGAPVAHAGDSTPQKTLVATVFPVWLLLRQVALGVPDVSVDLLLPAGTGCPHDYAMTPADRRKLARADVLVMNGLGLEGFLGQESKTRALLKPGASLVDAAHGLNELLASEGSGHSHPGHAADSSANPHLFASPSMMADMTRSIAAQLAEADPAHAEQYRANGELTAARLDALAGECAATGKKLLHRNVIAQHSIFDYLARDIGITVEAKVQRHDGHEPSAREMLDLVRLIRGKNVAAVLTEPQYPSRTGQTLANETAIPCIMLDPVANGPDDAPLDHYENVMRENLRTLEQALGTR